MGRLTYRGRGGISTDDLWARSRLSSGRRCGKCGVVEVNQSMSQGLRRVSGGRKGEGGDNGVRSGKMIKGRPKTAVGGLGTRSDRRLGRRGCGIEVTRKFLSLDYWDVRKNLRELPKGPTRSSLCVRGTG